LRPRAGEAEPRKGRTGPRVSPAGTAASAWALTPRLSAPTMAFPTTARSIAARTRAVAAVRTSIAVVSRIATPTGGALPRRPTHRSTHEAWATRVRPPTSVGASRPAPFASTPSRPMTLAAAGTRVRCAPLAPSAVAHESVPVEYVNSSTAARTAAQVSEAAPRARGKAAPACCTATQNAAQAARCTTPALRGSSVPGPAKTSGRVFRPRPATSTSSRATTVRATDYRQRPSAGAASPGTARSLESAANSAANPSRGVAAVLGGRRESRIPRPGLALASSTMPTTAFSTTVRSPVMSLRARCRARYRPSTTHGVVRKRALESTMLFPRGHPIPSLPARALPNGLTRTPTLNRAPFAISTFPVRLPRSCRSPGYSRGWYNCTRPTSMPSEAPITARSTRQGDFTGEMFPP
jgi:hypothetical protein